MAPPQVIISQPQPDNSNNSLLTSFITLIGCTTLLAVSGILEEWGEGENINIYITGQRAVNNTFYKLICKTRVASSCSGGAHRW